MYGIDTPESRTRNKDEKARGLLAKIFLQEQIDSCTNLVIQTKKDAKGKFGRILGDLVADGKNINQLMIAKHMAVRYIGQSKSDIESEHLLNRKVLIQEGLFTPVEK